MRSSLQEEKKKRKAFLTTHSVFQDEYSQNVHEQGHFGKLCLLRGMLSGSRTLLHLDPLYYPSLCGNKKIYREIEDMLLYLVWSRNVQCCRTRLHSPQLYMLPYFVYEDAAHGLLLQVWFLSSSMFFVIIIAFILIYYEKFCFFLKNRQI